MKTKRSRVDREGRFKPLPKAGNGVQLLLIQSVDHLGKQGDVVTVKRGYALNYLLPQGLATVATDHHRRMVEKHRAKLMEIEKARLASLRQLADSIAKQSVTIEANANEEGHLYGSVNANEIAAALKAAGFHITTDQVRLEGPLKELGLYTVKIHLHAEIDAELKVWVVPSVTSETPASEKQDKGEKGDKAKTERPKTEKPKAEKPKAEKAEKPEKTDKKKAATAAAPAAE
jgi:large subunit ribosomal protein L9